MPVKQPRNTKQVKIMRSELLEKHRLLYDSLYNLHELASDVPDFVQSIRTHPDLVCVCGSKALHDELDRVLMVDSPSALVMLSSSKEWEVSPVKQSFMQLDLVGVEERTMKKPTLSRQFTIAY